jgi:hypothetical protein
LASWARLGIIAIGWAFMNDPTAAREFKYKAFISYSHRDRQTADWLHRALENYRIPPQLVGTPGRDGAIPKQLFPIFRDRDELSTSPDLSADVREALEQSANLVVICSKSAAKSRWVNQEITLFKQLGRARRVHALIIDGEPGAVSPAEECFPPALSHKLGPDGNILEGQREEPIAADLRPGGDGKNDAKIKLLAGLLGIPLNSLRQREVIAARRRLRIRQAVSGAIAALALAAGLAGWQSMRFRGESDERLVPGVRVERHATTVDLSGWRETTKADIDNSVKKSLALSTDHYTVVKTQEYGNRYVHIVGTSSAVPPDVVCQGCKVAPRPPDKASRTAHEYNVTFDISHLGLEESQDLDFSIKYWNAFQTPDQWWVGFRVLLQTQTTEFTVIFPPAKHPSPETIQFYYHDTKDHPYVGEQKAVLEKDDVGLVSKIVWSPPYPGTDRSYRIRWDWSVAPKPD